MSAQKKIVFNYIKGFIFSLLTIISGIAVAYWLDSYDPPELLFQIISLVGFTSFGASIFGKLGWDIQTWGGNSKPEKLNDRLFYTLYFSGLFLTALSNSYNIF